MKLTIKQVSEITGHSEQTIRIALQRGIFEFGAAFIRPGSTRYTYVIYPEKVYELYGKKEE